MNNRKVYQRYTIQTKRGREFIIDHYKVNGYYSCDIYRVSEFTNNVVWYQSFNRDTKLDLFRSVDGNVNYIKENY